jgi:hypothetical protein
MITLAAALDRAAATIDAVLAQRLRALESPLLLDGCEDMGAIDVVLDEQREADAQWRAQTLADLRRQLEG